MVAPSTAARPVPTYAWPTSINFATIRDNVKLAVRAQLQHPLRPGRAAMACGMRARWKGPSSQELVHGADGGWCPPKGSGDIKRGRHHLRTRAAGFERKPLPPMWRLVNGWLSGEQPINRGQAGASEGTSSGHALGWADVLTRKRKATALLLAWSVVGARLRRYCPSRPLNLMPRPPKIMCVW